MSRQTELDRTADRLTLVRLLLPVGWMLTAIGYFGPWIAHPTAALTLGGVDMGEFVKFLPDVLDGSLKITRQIFYLPPLAVAVGVSLLAGSRRLGYHWLLHLLMVILAVPISLQLLPPAWSLTSLMAAEFRLQTAALGAVWLLLAGSWLLGRLPPQLTASLAALLALAAGGLPTWQFLAVKPAIDKVYQTPPSTGWGFSLCLFGLAVTAGVSVSLVLRGFEQSRRSWPIE